MKLKKLISSFLAFTFAVSLVNAVPQIVLASNETVSQTVFELDIEDMLGGNVPNGATLNENILDDMASSASSGLISDVVSAETEFLKINFTEAAEGLEGTATGIYTIEIITNVNDSDSTCKNGTTMYLKGTSDMLVFRARENSDICAMPNTWANLHWQTNTGATATYIMENLNVYDGSAEAHYAKRDTSPQYNAYANGHALEAGNASEETPINILTVKAAKDRRANIKSIKITRLAEVEREPETAEITVASEDDEKGTVDVDGINAQNMAVIGEDVTLTAIPEIGYAFDGWYKDGDDEAISFDKEYTFEVSESTAGSYIAKFKRVAMVNQTVFELNIENILNGNIPNGVTLNDDILDSTNSSNTNGLISTVVSANTDFLTIDFEEAVADLPGEDTGIYTIALVTNVNDSNSANKNGTMMYLEGISKHLVFRARESSDICAMPNSWTNLWWQANTGATASYGIENLNIYDGSAEAHYAMRDSSPQYSSYANGHAIAAGNANEENPISALTLTAPNGYRVNIKSLVIVRQAIVPFETYNIGAESEDENMGSVDISSTSVESGESVTLTAIPEENCIFEGWYEEGSSSKIANAGAIWTFVPTESKNYVAKFIYATTYDITIKSADEEKGIVSVSKNTPYYEDDEIVLSAVAKTGYIFDGWYKTGTVDKISSNSTYTIVASEATEGQYVAKFITAAFEEQQMYEFNLEEILNGTTSLPSGITLNESILDESNSSAEGGLKSDVNSSAQTLITIDFDALISSLNLQGINSGIYNVELSVNVKDDDEAINGTDLYAVTSGGSKQLLTASESAGVKATTGTGMNGGGDSYNRTYVTYSFEINVQNGTVTSMLTDQTGSNIFSSVANGQTVNLSGVSESNPITKLEIKNIANQRANVKSLNISRNVAIVDYGNNTPIFNETCVSLIDANGEKISGNSVTSAIKSIKIDFKSVLDEATVSKNNVYVEKDGTKLDVEPVHCDCVVTFDVNGLLPSTTYKVCVLGGVKNTSGVSVRSAGEYSFTTKAGECNAQIKSTKTGSTEVDAVADLSQGNKLDVVVDFVNTFASPRDLYVVYTAYKNNVLVDIQIAEYSDNGYNISGKLTPSFTVGDMSEITSISVFVLDEWSHKNILDKKNIGAALTHTNSNITETAVKVDNSANKIVITAVADTDDEIWIEVVKGNKAHTQIFDGLSKTDDIYSTSLPISFFIVTKGSFSVDVSLVVTGDYTVYVKNLTDNEMLIDGKSITFTDSATYESVVNGLDTSSSDAFVASITDDVAKKLGFDISLNAHLSADEINAVKTNIFTEGLSATNDELNREMYTEYAVMEVINNNTTVTAEVAADVVDALDDIINSDLVLKSWFDRYIVDTDDETAFINKLLATEPLTAGTDKVATRSALTDAVKVALVLEIAKAPNGYTNIGSAFDAFKSAFGRTSVSSSNDIYDDMIGIYANKSAFLNKYDELVGTSGGTGGNSGGDNGGTGGGNSSGSPNGSSGNFSINFADGGNYNPAVGTNQPTPMNKNIFNDIDSVPWAQEAIVTLRVKNVIAGKTETEFCPNENITREEFTKLIAAAFAGNAEKAELSFKDTDPNAWYYPYIQQAKGAGLVNGMSDSQFGIGQKITRQDMAVMIFNAAKYKNVVGNSEPEEFPFADDRDISNYAKEAIYTLKTMGIINGVDADNFAPLATATRAEAAVLIYRLLLK